MTRISIVGAGRVGLVTGACFAEKGYDVVCVDIDAERICRINRASPLMHEQGLAELLGRNVPVRLRGTTDCYRAVLDTDVTFIAVGTPLDGDHIDLANVEAAALAIGAALRDKASYHVVAVKSTVVPGTADEFVRQLLERASGKRAGADFGLGSNPEFLTEGTAVHDFMCPDRIVLGAGDERALDVLSDLYRGFEAPIIATNNKTAEMIKYASNALLAVMISFSNEVGNLCAGLEGIDVVDVMKAIHLNHYLSTSLTNGSRFVAPIASFLEAGCGFGGSCLPKDVRALITHGRYAGQPMCLLESALRINQGQYRHVLALLEKHFPSLAGIPVTVLGLAYKPDTDDVRESPAIPIIQSLLDRGAQVRLYDPVAGGEASWLFGGEVDVCEELTAAVRDAAAVVVVTRWKEFEALPEVLARMDPQPVLIDGRRMLDKSRFAKYEGIGMRMSPAWADQDARLR